jgi:biotin operon repressor
MQQVTLEGRPWEPPQPSDPLDVQVLAILQDGRVHDRHHLAAEVGTSVRQVRASVSRLRALGWPIGFGDNGGGYRLAWERPALEVLLRKYRSQALAELRIFNRLKRVLQRWAA